MGYSPDDFCPQQITVTTRSGIAVKTETFDGWFEQDDRKGKAWKLIGRLPGAPPSLAQNSFKVTPDQTKKKFNVTWDSPRADELVDFDNYIVT